MTVMLSSSGKWAEEISEGLVQLIGGGGAVYIYTKSCSPYTVILDMKVVHVVILIVNPLWCVRFEKD